MRGWRRIAVIGLVAIVVPALAKPPTNHVYGPEPDWNTYRQLAEQAVMAKLYDPDSAKFIWTYGYHKGSGKPVLQPTVFGYLACGQVNARNRMGGYTGYSDFMVVIDYGTVLSLGSTKPQTEGTRSPAPKAEPAGFIRRCRKPSLRRRHSQKRRTYQRPSSAARRWDLRYAPCLTAPT